jgi:hypothetical protein
MFPPSPQTLRDGRVFLLSLFPQPARTPLLRDALKTVGRDIQKMHAFVRFRLVATDGATGRKQLVALFEPECRSRYPPRSHQTTRNWIPSSH